MSSSLLLTRRFAPLFWTQFFSAFSDNFLKNSLVFLILFHIGGSDAEALITLAAAVFIAPYFFLSALGGELADRYDKAVVARRLKFAEIGIAFIAVLGFAMHSVLLLFVALFLFGVIASLFGPIKYGILPDHLARSELPAGNALVEGATFIAILLGTIVGGVAAKDGGDPSHFAFLMIVFSLMCWGASLLIPRTGQAAPNLVVQKNILASTAGLLKFLREDPRLLVGRAGDQLVLAGRRGRALADAAAGQERARRQRGGGHRLPRDLLDFHRRRLGARGLARGRTHHPAADLDRCGAAGPVRHRSRLVDARRGADPASRRLSRDFRLRPRLCGSRSTSPGSPSPAACSSCRPSRRCRPGPAPTAAPAWWPRSMCSMPRSWREAR